MAVGGNDIKATVRLEGGAAFKQEITGVNNSMKQLDAESKKVSATFEGQANSLEALTAKQKVLADTLEQAERKVQLYSDRIKSLKSQQENIANSTEKYRNELKDAQEALSKMEKGSEAYEKQAKAVEALSRKVALGEQNQERANKEIAKYTTEQTKAETAVEQLNHEIDQNARYLNEAENSADKCATSIDEYGRKTKQAAEETKGIGDVAKVALGNIAADAAQKLADKAIEAAKAMVEVGSNFEAAMSEVEAISGAAGSDLDQMAAKAKTLGSTTKFTATEVAEGFKYMSLAGWDTSQMLESIDGVVNLAAASEMDLGQASDMVTDYLSAFGLAASDAGKMVDEMVYAQSHSNTSTQQLGDAFGNCAANMNAAGQSMETTTAILEAMANQGTKGAQAGTALAAVMRDITQKMSDGAIKIGDTSVAVMDSEGNFRDLVDILADVEKATDGMGTAQKASALQSTFTARSIKAVNQVLNEGTENIKGYKDALTESDGAAAQAAETMMDNFKGAVTEAQSAAEGLGVAIFERVAGPLTGIVDVASDVMGAITDALTPPPKTDLEKFLDRVIDRVNETKDALENIGTIEFNAKTNIAEVEHYREILEKATKGEELSALEKYELQAAVDALGGSIPQLAKAYDAERGAIDLTTESVGKLLDAYKSRLKMDAISDMLREAYRTQQEASIAVDEATDAYDEAASQLEAYGLTLKNVESYVNDSSSSSADLAQNLVDIGVISYDDKEAVQGLIDVVRNSKKAMDDASDSYEDASKEVGKLEKATEQETGALSDQNNASNKNKKATEENTKAQEKHADSLTLTTDRAGEMVIAGADLEAVERQAAEAAEENAEATEEEAAAIEKAGLAWMQHKSFAQSAVEATIKFSQEAKEQAKEAEERAKASAEAEKAALEETRKAYEDNYNSIKDTLSQKLSLWDAFDGGEDVTVEQMIANLQSQNEGITRYKQEMEEVIATYGDQLGPDLINTLQSMGADAANTWHHMWITMSQDNAPELFAQMGQEWTTGLDLADQIASYCAGNLTAYQIATGKMGSTKIEWTGLRESVEEMTPELDAAIQAAQAAGVAIPDGLAEGLASGETTTSAAVEQITSAMQGTFQGLYEIAQQSGADIPEGLSEGIDGSAESYQAAINTLTESLSQAGNEAGTAAAEEISTGLDSKQSDVETSAGETASAAAKGADNKKSEFNSAGQSSAQQYSQGITSQRAAATSAGRQLAQAAKQGADGKDGEFKNVGQNMASALAAGIRAGQSSAINAAVSMAVEAYQRAKAAIGQHSPTGIFKDELGKNVPLAFAAGIKQYQNVAETAAAQMSMATFNAAQFTAAVNGMEPRNTVPAVNVDTSPIAQMLGGMETGTQIIQYITVQGGDNLDSVGNELAQRIKQYLRTV